MIRKQTYDLLLPIFNEIPKTLKVSSIVDNADGTFTVNSCDTLWLTPGYSVAINEIEYLIVDIDPNQWVKFEGTVIPDVAEFDIYEPHKFHGTILAQNGLLDQISQFTDKLPMIWLHEITKERFDTDEENTLERESECDIYFLVDCKKEWITIDHDSKAVKPMRNLLALFIETLKDSTAITDRHEITYQQFDHANFGVYLESKGHIRTTFSESLSGTQLRITIPFCKTQCFNCN